MGLHVGSQVETRVVSTSADYEITAANHHTLVNVTASAAPRAVTVPLASDVPHGFVCHVRRDPASAYDVTLSTVSLTLTEDGQGVVLISDGSAWFTFPTMGPAGADGEDGTNGTDGEDGAPGADGKTWHNGTGAPGDGVGVDGDFYLDTAADAYYGPKASGTWSGTGPVSLVGEDGAPGPNEVTTSTDTNLTGTLRGDGSHVGATKDNLAASTAPATTNDTTEGYAVGSRWLDTTAEKEYVCLDPTEDAAVWKETTGGGSAGSTAENVAAESSGGSASTFSKSDHVHALDPSGALSGVQELMKFLVRVEASGPPPDAPSLLTVGIDELLDYMQDNLTFGSGLETGDIIATAKSTASTGFLLCDGSAVSRTTYADLFSAIGTTYGSGDGSTTFNVPDMRGRSPVGVGTGAGGGASGTGLPSGGSALTAVSRATWLGAETHALSVAELASHRHSLGYTPSNSITGGAVAAYAWQATTSYTNYEGSGTAHNNMQPVMGLNFQIRT